MVGGSTQNTSYELVPVESEAEALGGGLWQCHNTGYAITFDLWRFVIKMKFKVSKEKKKWEKGAEDAAKDGRAGGRRFFYIAARFG